MKQIMNHRKWICLNLILMILLSGMCYESVKADSLLQCLHTGTIETQQMAHQLNQVFYGIPQNEGAEELFGIRGLDSRLSFAHKTGRFGGIRLLFLACLFVTILIGWKNPANRVVSQSAMPPCNQQTIISYIHQQDGAKG